METTITGAFIAAWLIAAILALPFLVAGLVIIRRRQRAGSPLITVLGYLCLAIGVLLLAISVAFKIRSLHLRRVSPIGSSGQHTPSGAGVAISVATGSR